MNILLVNIWMDTRRGGGTAERVRHLAVQLSALGCTCTVLTMGETPWRSEFEKANVRVVSVPFFCNRFPIPILPLRSLFRLARNADIVFVMGFWFLLAAVSCVLARLAGSILVLCPAGSLTRFGRAELHKRIFFWMIGRWMLDTASSVIATTSQEKNLLASDFSVSDCSMFLSPNGINPAVLLNTSRLDHGGLRTVLFLGRLTAIKGPDLLLDAFASIVRKLPGTRLLFAGPDFGMRAQLESRVHHLGLEGSVCFAGFVDESQRAELLRSAEILVVPSRSEVMSLVALEAGAAGVPVILTDQCGFNEVADVGGGLVVEVDVVALGEAILLLMSDPTTLKIRGNRLKQFVLENYAWQRVAGELLGELRRLR